jgi:uncharacterized damage-inducible protein DinB
MIMHTPKSGRPRRYDLRPDADIANPEVAQVLAALDELSARLFDLTADLPQQVLDFVPAGATNSIAMLVVHMAWAEAHWVTLATQTPIPNDLRPLLSAGKQGPSGELSPFSGSAAELLALCKDVRERVTKPALTPLQDVDVMILDSTHAMMVRGVLLHVLWHWTYHSGQVGLLRRLAGARYQWTFDQGS